MLRESSDLALSLLQAAFGAYQCDGIYCFVMKAYTAGISAHSRLLPEACCSTCGVAHALFGATQRGTRSRQWQFNCSEIPKLAKGAASFSSKHNRRSSGSGCAETGLGLCAPPRAI